MIQGLTVEIEVCLSDTQGGEVNYGKFFGGEQAGIFGGVEIFLPKLNGTRLKIEYDSTNYGSYEDGGEGYLPVAQDKSLIIRLFFLLLRIFI